MLTAVRIDQSLNELLLTAVRIDQSLNELLVICT